jgi:hypothetical protein
MSSESSHEIHVESMPLLQFTPQTSTDSGRTMSTKPGQDSTDVNQKNSNTKDSLLQSINGECGKIASMEVDNARLLNDRVSLRLIFNTECFV